MIDGYPVHVNDNVFVLGVGYGSVTRVSNDGAFSVRTGQGNMNFSTGGMVGTNKRMVYWDDPIVVLPCYNKHLWRTYIKVTRYIFGMLESLFRTGNVPEVDENVDEA